MLPTLTLDRFDSTWQFLSIGTKKKSRNEEKASGITTYEPSKLYNPSDTFVALEESSADAGFFQAEICRTFGRIFVYKRTLEIAYLILSFIKRSYVLFLSKYKYWTGESNRPYVTKLKLIFSALGTPFSFQAFAHSPRSKSRRFLYVSFCYIGPWGDAKVSSFAMLISSYLICIIR